MAVPSKGKKRAASARRGSDDVEITTGPGLAPPDRTLPITGSYVAHYTAQRASGTTWTPQSTVVEAVFNRFGSVHGAIHLNTGGTDLGILKYRGTYDLQHDTDLGTISGWAYFDLLDATGEVFRRQQLYVVKRNAAELFFMLAQSYEPDIVQPQDASQPPYVVYRKVHTDSSVEGVFYKTD